MAMQMRLTLQLKDSGLHGADDFRGDELGAVNAVHLLVELEKAR